MGGYDMKRHALELIIQQIANSHHTTPENVRHEMQLAMEEGQKSADPSIQAMWNAIPRKGKKLTLEEFISYLATQITQG